MSRSVILALSPFATACVICAVGVAFLPIETRGRALLVNFFIICLKTDFNWGQIKSLTTWHFVLFLYFSKMPEIHQMKMKNHCTFVTKHDLILKLEQFSMNCNVSWCVLVVLFMNNYVKSVKTLCWHIGLFLILTGNRIGTHKKTQLDIWWQTAGRIKKRGKSYVTEHYIG